MCPRILGLGFKDRVLGSVFQDLGVPVLNDEMIFEIFDAAAIVRVLGNCMTTGYLDLEG